MRNFQTDTIHMPHHNMAGEDGKTMPHTLSQNPPQMHTSLTSPEKHLIIKPYFNTSTRRQSGRENKSKENFLKPENKDLVPVDRSESSLTMEHNIVGYSAIQKQTSQAWFILKRSSAPRLFTI
jgi:hypothetical protein